MPGVSIGPHRVPDPGEQFGIIYPAENTKGYKNDHKILKEMKKLHLDIVKLTYEWYGIDYCETNNVIDYENDVYNTGINVVIEKTMNWGAIDWASIPDGKSGQACADCLIYAHKILMGCQDHVTAGIMSCAVWESGLKPHNWQEGEKAGNWSANVNGRTISSKANGGGHYGVGLFGFTFLNGCKGDMQRAIGPAPYGYALEAQPISTQLQLMYGLDNDWSSLLEISENFLPWPPDVKEIIKKRLVDLKEITEPEETGKNQYWDKSKDLSELEILACNQVADFFSLCGPHGAFTFQQWLSIRKDPQHGAARVGRAYADPKHTIKRRTATQIIYKYIRGMRGWDSDNMFYNAAHNGGRV